MTRSPRVGFIIVEGRKKSRNSFPFLSLRTALFRNRFYPDTSDDEWNDWRWQFRQRIQTLAGLEHVFSLSDDEKASLAFSRGKASTLADSVLCLADRTA